MRTVTFSFTDQAMVPSDPQYAGIQGDHNATNVVFTLPSSWVTADYALRVEYVDGVGAFDTTTFLTRTDSTVSVSLPVAWTAAGGLAEIRLAAATLSSDGLPEETVAYSPVGYLYFDSRSGEPAAWREFPNRGLSSLIADARSATELANDTASELRAGLESGAFDGATWLFGTAVSGIAATVTATVPDAKVGDFYLNTGTDYVYVMTAQNTWKPLGCIRGATGATGAKGEDGYGILPVTNLATTTTGTGDHIYEVAIGTNYTTLPSAFIVGFYMTYGMTAADKVWLYGSARLWEGTESNMPDVPLSAGYHLFAYDNGMLREVSGAKGIPGEKGEKGDPGERTDWYATCATAATTAAKVATVATAGSGFVLKTGAMVTVKFTNTNTASSPTLNVNGTGAIAIKSYGTTAVSTYMWQPGGVHRFVYDGTYWIMQDGELATTTYYGKTKLSSSTSSTSTTLAATPSAVKTAYDLAAGKNARVTLYENDSGYSITYANFMTADPSLYDYFIVSTNMGAFPVYRSDAAGSYISGGFNRCPGGNDFYAFSVCFSPNNSTTGSCDWMLYDIVCMKYSSGTWTQMTGANALKIYKIEGVKLG